MKRKPSGEEIEFRLAEIDAFEKRYGLEDFGDLLDWLLTTIRDMTSRGDVPETEEGVMKAMGLIVGAEPEIEDYIKKFVAAAEQETLNEMKQAERPN